VHASVLPRGHSRKEEPSLTRHYRRKEKKKGGSIKSQRKPNGQSCERGKGAPNSSFELKGRGLLWAATKKKKEGSVPAEDEYGKNTTPPAPKKGRRVRQAKKGRKKGGYSTSKKKNWEE